MDPNTISYNRNSRSVRIFISSTFRDFGEERDLLIKRVFPELRRRARDRLVEVIGVDLRWGITEEDSQKGETLPICLKEIERSHPYFLGLLGDRYGWTPTPKQYPETLLATQPWLSEHAGGKSVTELEILHGVLNNPAMEGQAFFYFRDAKWSEDKGDDFRSEGTEESSKLTRLKERIKSSLFPVTEYRTPEEASDRIMKDLWALIDRQYPTDAVPDELQRESGLHESYAFERRRLYIGQEKTVLKLLARLTNASDESSEVGSITRVTVVVGESGTGKSALIANVLNQYRCEHPEDVVIEHYIGSSVNAANPVRVVTRLAETINRLISASTVIEERTDKLWEQLVTSFDDASCWARREDKRIVIALDALDKLSTQQDLRWLPVIIAPHIRIILSTLSGEAKDALAKREYSEIEAGQFTTEIARRYTEDSLGRRGRKLPKNEIERIVRHPKSALPLFLRTLIEELSLFGSYEGLPGRITECLTAQEPDDLFEVILGRMENDFGRDKVQRPLEAIWASADGMSDDEVIGFSGLTPLDWARVRLGLDDSLYESGGFIHLSHAYIEKAIGDRYVPDEDINKDLHLRLAEWWGIMTPSTRSKTSIDHHTSIARTWDRVRDAKAEAEVRLDDIRKNKFFRFDTQYIAVLNRADALRNRLLRRPRWHPVPAEWARSGGPQEDYCAYFSFKCCGATAAGVNAPSQFRATGCREIPREKLAMFNGRSSPALTALGYYWDDNDLRIAIEMMSTYKMASQSNDEADRNLYLKYADLVAVETAVVDLATRYESDVMMLQVARDYWSKRSKWASIIGNLNDHAASEAAEIEMSRLMSRQQAGKAT